MIMDIINMFNSKYDCRGKYAVVNIQCECSRPRVAYLPKDERFYCKNCNRIIYPSLVAGTFENLDEMRESMCERAAEPDHTDSFLERISSLESEIADRDVELERSHKIIREYREMLGDKN